MNAVDLEMQEAMEGLEAEKEYAIETEINYIKAIVREETKRAYLHGQHNSGGFQVDFARLDRALQYLASIRK